MLQPSASVEVSEMTIEIKGVDETDLVKQVINLVPN